MASDLSILIPRLRAAIAALPPGPWPLDSTTLQVVMSARRCGKTVQTYVELAAEAAPALLEHAELYEHLRTRPLDTIALAKGGVFAGRVPDNVVLNGEDLDRAIREEMGRPQPAEAEPVAEPVAADHRKVACAAADKLHALGYAWDGQGWSQVAVPTLDPNEIAIRIAVTPAGALLKRTTVASLVCAAGEKGGRPWLTR